MSRLLTALLGVAMLAGCASAQAPTLASRFVRQGTPTVDLGGPRLAPGREAHARPRSDHAAKPAKVSRFSGATFEAVDGRLREALTLVNLAPTVEHHLRIARAYRLAGIMDQAYDYLTRSLTMNGPHAEVYDERARLWRDWGNLEYGLADAYRAVYLKPQSAALQNTLGTILYQLKQPAEAEFRFHHALNLDPHAWYALANLCHLNLARGRTREAIVQCRQATAVRKKQSN